MDAAAALADLTEISSQIELAVLVEEDGTVAASTLADEERARRIAAAALRLLEAAGDGREPPAQLEAATREGSVFVVRDGGRVLVATTSPDPTVGLVFYDLKSCLRGIDPPKPKRARRAKPKEPEPDA